MTGYLSSGGIVDIVSHGTSMAHTDVVGPSKNRASKGAWLRRVPVPGHGDEST